MPEIEAISDGRKERGLDVSLLQLQLKSKLDGDVCDKLMSTAFREKCPNVYTLKCSCAARLTGAFPLHDSLDGENSHQGLGEGLHRIYFVGALHCA